MQDRQPDRSTKAAYLYAGLICCSIYTAPSLAQQPINDGGADSGNAASEASSEGNQVMDYQRCVRQIVARDVPAADKRAAINNTCKEQRQMLFSDLSQNHRAIFLSSMDERIDLLLSEMHADETIAKPTTLPTTRRRSIQPTDNWLLVFDIDLGLPPEQLNIVKQDGSITSGSLSGYPIVVTQKNRDIAFKARFHDGSKTTTWVYRGTRSENGVQLSGLLSIYGHDDDLLQADIPWSATK